MIAAGCTCSKSKKKAKDSRTFFVLQETLEVRGHSSLAKGDKGDDVLYWSQPRSLSPMWSCSLVHPENFVRPASSSSGHLQTPLALRKDPVNQIWRDGMEKLRPGQHSKGSRKWIQLLEHTTKETCNVPRVSHQVHPASAQSLVTDWWVL